MAAPLVVKICGVTTKADADIAANAGADMLGFICHPSSKRYVDRVTLGQLAQHSNRRGKLGVGVFVNQVARPVESSR